MIDAKQAVYVAKEKAVEMLGERAFNLEEIERETYKGHDVWQVTLSFLPTSDLDSTSQFAAILAAGRLKYKRFAIDSESGELVAMTLREVATQ